MPRRKKTTAAAEETAIAAAVAEAPAAVEAPAEEKKPAAKKTAGRKPAAKKPAGRKPAAKKTASKKASDETVYIQYNGAEVTPSGLIERAKAESGVKSPSKVDVYVKPEENMVYYVVDNNPGSFSLS